MSDGVGAGVSSKLPLGIKSEKIWIEDRMKDIVEYLSDLFNIAEPATGEERICELIDELSRHKDRWCGL